MKQLITFFLSLILTLPLLQGQTARLQVIHNAPDDAAMVVDVWVNDILLLDDFTFQEASAFIDAPTDTDFDVSIAGPNSTDTTGAIFRKTFNLPANSTSVVVASGGLGEMGATAFDLRPYVGQEQATNQDAGEVSVNIIHGAYDAPEVDIFEVQVPAGELIGDLSFGEDIGTYANLPAADFDVQVRTQTGVVAGEFDVNVSSLANGAATVLASGFLDPSAGAGSTPFGLIAVLADGTVLQLPAKAITGARLQVIHNAPDPAAAMVDVWLNDVLLLNDFPFQGATPYIDAPAGSNFDVSIALPTSTDTAGALFRKTFLLPSNSTSVVVASGGLAETGATAFDLRAYIGQEQAANQGAGEVSVNIIHGSYDAPEVDIVEVQIPAGELVGDLSFGEDIGAYANLPAADFDVQVRTQAGIVAGEFDVNVSGLADGAAVVLASGFLSPPDGAKPFGLIAVLADGNVLQLPAKVITGARLQAIHNVPDPLASVVDVWLNDVLLLDNFPFQGASPYIDAPAGTNFDISIALPTSTDTVGAIFRETFLLPSNSTSVVVASGGLLETGDTGFGLRVYPGQEQATNQGAGEVSVNIIHGAYDAPEVDIVEVQIPAGELVGDLAFGEGLEAYANLPAADFDVQVRTQAGIVAGEFDVDVSGLADGAAIVLASGLLAPPAGTASFGLIAVLPDGTVLQLPAKDITPARLQVIHNCAATDAATVDIWLNNTPLLDDFNFRTASPFIDAPAGTAFDVSVALPSSTDTTGALFRQTFVLESNQTYIAIASGTVGSGTYSPATPFSIEVITPANEAATTSGNVDVLVWHGATDAPIVDVIETQVGAGTIVDNLAYGQAAGYLDLPATNFDLSVADSSGNTVVAAYDADITGLADLAITVLASGFLSPADNNDGPAFGLWVALPAGGALVELPSITTSIEDLGLGNDLKIYPNPTQGSLNIDFEHEGGAKLAFEIITIQGQIVGQKEISAIAGKNQINFELNGLNPGYYFIKLTNGDKAQLVPFIKN